MAAPGVSIETGDSGRAEARTMSMGGATSPSVHGGGIRTSQSFDVVESPSETATRYQGGYKTEANEYASRTKPESAAYFATIRRRGIAGVKFSISKLDARRDEPDFAVHTFPITQSINQLVNDLIDARFEGNSREILRRLRNTILDGGWEHYRVHDARRRATQVLDFLERAETVIPRDVKRMTEVLKKGGLNPYAAPLLQYEPDGAPEDGEAEVLD